MAQATQTIPTVYKQTEIGMIPVDWEVKKLDDIFNITAGRDLVKSDYSEIEGESHKCPLYSNSLENKGLYGYTKVARHKKNCLTITARGTIGRSHKRHTDFDAIGRLLILDPKVKLDGFFISEYLNNKIIFSIESTGVPQLTAPQAAKYLLAFPKEKEQAAIATALSDTDALIEKLEKLIAKKKAVKQGAMQQLLTGKKRLPGFSGEWEVKKLGSVADLLKGSGLSKNKITVNGKYECILYGELFTTYSRVINDIKSRTNTKEGLFSIRGDILMPGSTTTVGIDLATASSVQKSGVLLGGDIIVIRKKQPEKYDSKFLANYLTHISKYSIAGITQGITIIHLHGRRLKDIDINIASDVKEQTAIATVLSDMDAEIEKLENKLGKYRQIKTGMMQQLLTGKIRLLKN